MANHDSSDPASKLTFQEISHLNDRKLEIKKAHSLYIVDHPEIKDMLNDFMSAVLLDKPNNIFTFASDHFAELVPAAASSTSTNNFTPLVICGPSGAGLKTLVGLLTKSFPNSFGFSVAHTSRDPRPGEVEGEDYFFSTSRDEMTQSIEDGKFVTYAEAHGELYATSFKAVQAMRDKGIVPILDIEVEAVRNVKDSKLAPRYLFVAPPSVDALEDRLREKGVDSEQDIQKCLSDAHGIIEYGEGGNFDKVLVNEVLEDSFLEFKNTILGWYPHLGNVGGEKGGDAKEGGGEVNDEGGGEGGEGEMEREEMQAESKGGGRGGGGGGRGGGKRRKRRRGGWRIKIRSAKVGVTFFTYFKENWRI